MIGVKLVLTFFPCLSFPSYLTLNFYLPPLLFLKLWMTSCSSILSILSAPLVAFHTAGPLCFLTHPTVFH